MKSSLENLEIYKISVELSNVIWNIVLKWDKFERNTVGSQLVKAIDSVAANISEGYGRGSKSDNARMIKIARGSLFETRYWIGLAHQRNLITKEEAQVLNSKIENLLPRLSSYINYLTK
jgi:four helix bundle protein